MKLGEKIRFLRNDQDMTQKELAKLLSISASTIGMYEQGRRIPDIDTISKLSRIFNVSSDYLLGLEVLNNRLDDNITKTSHLNYESLGENEKKCLNTFRQLNIDNQDIIIGEMKKTLREQNHDYNEKNDSTTLPPLKKAK